MNDNDIVIGKLFPIKEPKGKRVANFSIQVKVNIALTSQTFWIGGFSLFKDVDIYWINGPSSKYIVGGNEVFKHYFIANKELKDGIAELAKDEYLTSFKVKKEV